MNDLALGLLNWVFFGGYLDWKFAKSLKEGD